VTAPPGVIVERAYRDLIELFPVVDYTPAERKLLTDPVMYYGRMLEPTTREYALATLARNVGRAISFLQSSGSAHPTLLDIGSGLGMNSLIFASLGFDVVGVDLNADAVALATKQRALFEDRWQRPLNVRFIAADFHDYAATAPSDTFDRVFSMSAFAHIPPLEKTVGEIARMSKRANAKVYLWDINRPAIANATYPTLAAVKREFAETGFTRQFAIGGTVVPRQVWRAPAAFHPIIRIADELLCRMPTLAFTYACEFSR
jgi:SAM-dependent methyltransferase